MPAAAGPARRPQASGSDPAPGSALVAALIVACKTTVKKWPQSVAQRDNWLLRLIVSLSLLSALTLAAGSHLEDGIALQRAGKLKEADRELRVAITDTSAAGNRGDLLKALSIESWISVSLGNYRDAMQQASEAVKLRRALGDEKHLADDLNTLALANQNLGDYGAAVDYFEQALRADQAAGDAEGEITRLNNIGSVYYFKGRYLDALRCYDRAKAEVDATSSESWNPRRRQLTLANLAAVYQRLGKEETALEFYRTLVQSQQALPPRERAQFLLNQGALYRRLGDPVKALELYRSAQDLYAVERYSDGEIGALRNIGIARAIDLDDLRGALDAFSTALRLAQMSSNRRGIVQSSLYRGETFRRLGRLKDAAADAQAALATAKAAGLVEEQWRTFYLLGQLAEDQGDRDVTRKYYASAISLIESMRAGLQTVTLRGEFLADKRDVYDALIKLRLKEGAPADEVFRLIERSRSRTLSERVSLDTFQDLRAVQSHLGANSMLLDFWTGADSFAVLWISPTQAGVVHHAGGIQEAVAQLTRSLESGEAGWYDASRIVGSALLAGVPLERHLIVVPDGPLTVIPFEALMAPGSNALVVEESDVSYLPSAQFTSRVHAPRKTRLPWQRELVAIGDPPVENSDGLAEGWQTLPASRDEIRSIQQLLPGRSQAHLGSDAQKHYLGGLEGVPVLHLSTHAMVDPENPDRSRILLASDFLFQSEVYDLDLKGVDLVTVSACDTARGKVLRGEGVQAFSRAFLAAGAASTVTSLWRVVDQPSAAFMKQFYYFLAKRQTKAEALRSAKLEFLHSRARISHPRYWAAFVLTGDGATPVPLALSWGIILAGAGIIAAIALITRWAIKAARSARGTEAASTEIGPR